MIQPAYDLRRVSVSEVSRLCRDHHGYKSSSSTATYSFGVVEEGRVVAGYLWQPPPPGAARSVQPDCPQGVLALSRMVALPRNRRLLNHVSRPLRRQMRILIDRTRWPTLVTYSDEGQGHTGHVYKCSGWQPTTRSKVRIYENNKGERRSSYSSGG